MVFHLPAHLEPNAFISHIFIPQTLELGFPSTNRDCTIIPGKGIIGKVFLWPCRAQAIDAEIEPEMDELYSNNLQIKIIEVKVYFT